MKDWKINGNRPYGCLDNARMVLARQEEFCRKRLKRLKPALRKKYQHTLCAATIRASSTPLFSSLAARRIAAESLHDALLSGVESLDGERRGLIVTFAFADGLLDIAAPKVRLVPMQRKIRDALKKLRFEGVVVFEADVITDEAGAAHISLHAHALGWSMIPENEVKAATWAKQQSNRSAFRAAFGIPTVHIKPVASDQDLANLAFYVLKPPHSQKYRAKNRFGEIRLQTRHRRLSANRLARILEIYSAGTLRDWIFGAGRYGGHLADRVKHETFAWARENDNECSHTPSRKRLAKTWHHLWQIFEPEFQPAAIMTASSDRKSYCLK